MFEKVKLHDEENDEGKWGSEPAAASIIDQAEMVDEKIKGEEVKESDAEIDSTDEETTDSTEDTEI